MGHAAVAGRVPSLNLENRQPGPEQAIELMMGFADRTGLTSERSPRRYLWTDAFAVCNLLGIAHLTGDRAYLDLAQRLVDQVQRVLGKYDANDSRRGWISGLDDVEGALHPTRGGLRIGKPLPERQPGEALDAELEWERDGQYFHYLTKWMHALDQLSRATGQERFNIWARELAASAYDTFTYRPSPIGSPRLAWKMSVDLSRPLISSMGHHDALDGFITCAELELRAGRFAPRSEAPLSKALSGFASMIEDADWATGDALGIGGLLADAARAAQLQSHGAVPESLLQRLLWAALESLQFHFRVSELREPAHRRLAFRELGLAIGLSGVDLIAQAGLYSSDDLLQRLRPYAGLGREIVSFWSDPNHRRTPAWSAHNDINEVMLATALIPAGFLVLD